MAIILIYCNTNDNDSPKMTRRLISSLYHSLQELKSSGCDNIEAVVIYYKRQSSTTWKKVTINKVTDTKVTLQSVSYDEYDVKLTATNNENITSTSSIVTANFLPSKSV